MIVLDDHLVRDLVAGELPDDLETDDLATTNLWTFRLLGALAREGLTGALSKGVAHLDADQLADFQHRLREELSVLTVVPMREIVWSMASLQAEHRSAGRHLSVAMAEALAAAHHLEAEIAVAAEDVGPGLQSSAAADGIPFRVIAR